MSMRIGLSRNLLFGDTIIVTAPPGYNLLADSPAGRPGSADSIDSQQKKGRGESEEVRAEMGENARRFSSAGTAQAHKSGSEKGVFWKGGLFRKIHCPERF